MTVEALQSPLRSARFLEHWYLELLCFALAGYAVLGKGFAYLGIPPIYVGEILLLLGIATALSRGCIVAAIFNVSGIALCATMLWTAVRTIPYVRQYGFDALRDSVIVFYGLFAFICASLLLRDHAGLVLIIRRYRNFIPCLIILAPVIQVLAQFYPRWPNGQPLFFVKVHDASAHLAGAALFALVGFVRLGPLMMFVLLATAFFAFSQSREALVAFVAAFALAAIFIPDRQKLKQLAGWIAAAALVAAVAALLDVQIAVPGRIRPVAFRQVIDNLLSVFGHSDYQLTEATKEWRLMWWRDIIDYTLHGPYFWGGKGFGVNLADSDGFQVVALDSEEPLLRTPHSAHMTILARTGVIGLILWSFTLGSWLVAMASRLRAARRSDDPAWAGLFAFLLCFWMTLLISASFDVALEGPMLGIWFWVIFGIGIAAVVIHRHEQLSADRDLTHGALQESPS
jgi:hypothetical protein